MKKTVKSLIIAASVAAIAGIGAVSFASWEGTMTHETEGLKSANINTIGLTATDPSTTLLPYDQVGTYSNAVKMWDIKLTVGNPQAGYKITAEVDTELSVYILLDTNATASAPANDGAATTWQKLEYNVAAETTDYYAHVILVSSDTGDMNQAIDITFTLEEGSAS